MNDGDRSDWIDNDEGLYGWWRSSKLSKKKFIQQNREALTRTIDSMLSGERNTHYLAYETPLVLHSQLLANMVPKPVRRDVAG